MGDCHVRLGRTRNDEELGRDSKGGLITISVLYTMYLST